jgi:hypothetical protein
MSTELPKETSDLAVANVIGDFFQKKIENIRTFLDNLELEAKQFAQCHPSTAEMPRFDLCTTDEVKKLLAAMPDKQCPNDPMPTKLVKQCQDVLAGNIAHLINNSLVSGIFPDVWKEAIVTPLAKKPGLVDYSYVVSFWKKLPYLDYRITWKNTVRCPSPSQPIELLIAQRLHWSRFAQIF